jgi:hypothetical protein
LSVSKRLPRAQTLRARAWCADMAQAPAECTFAALPLALALKVFTSLPVDARAVCAAVCPAWSAMLKDRRCWTRLDLSPESGGHR